jgi:flagellar hook assembly protein FlgD
LQNYPNPFNPSTVINYSIVDPSHVTINVYDITGRMVRELVNEDKSAGQYSVDFRGNNLASGTYIYTIKAGNFAKTNKMILLK